MPRHTVFDLDFSGLRLARDRRAVHVAPGRPLPLAVLRFALPRVSLAAVVVQTPSGAIVRTILHGVLAAGEHALEWRGENDRGERVPR